MNEVNKSSLKYVVTRNYIRNRIDNEFSPPGELNKMQCYGGYRQQSNGDNYPYNHFLLFAGQLVLHT